MAVDLVAGTARGADGSDTLSGNDGGTQGPGQADFADCRAVAGPVVVDLAAGTASGADGNDVLSGIGAVFGSACDDQLTGSALLDCEFFRGGLGDDVIDGGAGFDIADYFAANASVVIDLASGSTSGADGVGTLIALEGVSGSEQADTLLGGAGNDWLSGRGGDDFIDGGAGFDHIIYEQATSAVTTDLVAGNATGGQGNDTLVGIENLPGAPWKGRRYHKLVQLRGDAGPPDPEGRDSAYPAHTCDASSAEALASGVARDQWRANTPAAATNPRAPATSGRPDRPFSRPLAPLGFACWRRHALSQDGDATGRPEYARPRGVGDFRETAGGHRHRPTRAHAPLKGQSPDCSAQTEKERPEPLFSFDPACGRQDNCQGTLTRCGAGVQGSPLHPDPPASGRRFRVPGSRSR